MLCQEEFVTLLDVHRQGWTKREIAAELGYDPATIARWLVAGGPPSPRVVPDSERVMTERCGSGSLSCSGRIRACWRCESAWVRERLAYVVSVPAGSGS